MRKVAILLCAAAAAVSGCAQSKGFDRSSMYSELKAGPVARAAFNQTTADSNSTPKEVTDADIAKVMALKPQLKVPFKLGVYFVPERYGRESRSWESRNWGPKWDAKDKEIEWLETLRAEGKVSQIIPISDFAAAGMSSDGAMPSLKYIRLAAARYGADAVLVIDNATSVDRYFNPASAAYLTIVGMFFVPGSNSDALVMVNGAVFDVGNEYLYCTSVAEGTVKRVGPQTMYDYETVQAARADAMKSFRDDVLLRIRRM